MRDELYGNARFEITRQLGGGAVGVVYEALDRERGVPVALKVLSSMSAETLTRFKREFRALQALRHPNLIELGELFEEGGQWFYSMELVDGVDFLAHVGVQVATLPSSVRITASARARAARARDDADPRRLAPERTMPCDEAKLRGALSQLAAALAELHDAGFVHRDVKPSNVLVADGPRVVLLDLGLVADAINPRRSLDLDTIVGTPLYMAPEQAVGRPCTAAADWYSLGVMLYEALTGIAPFEGSALEVLLRKQQAEPPAPAVIATGVPRDLDRLCAGLLAIAPEDRPTSREILRLLRAPGHERSAAPRARAATAADDAGFIGREQELGALADAFKTARVGGPVTIRLRGDSGVGKTALVRNFLRSINGIADVLVLEGRCYERESVPFKAFDGIVDSLARHLRAQPAGALSRLLPRNADLLAQTFPILQGLPEMLPRLLSRTQDQQQQRGLVFGAIRELLQNLARGAALVLVIDDVQWADADSAVLLRHLLQPPDAPPLLLIVVDRDGTDEPFELPPTELREIALGGLPAAAAAALAQRLLSPIGHGDLNLAEDIARETGGHPLYIDELVGHVASHGAANVHRGLRMRDVIWSRVRAIPASQFAALRVLCLAESPLPPEVVRIAAGTAERAFERDVAELRASNLVRASRDRLEPYHDQVRHTVNANLDDETITDTNRRLAMALEASGESRMRPELLIEPYLATGMHARAAHYAAEAGRRAAGAFAFDRASELFARALELGEWDAPARRSLLLARAEAAAQAGLGPVAARAFLEAADGADAATRVDCHTRAAKQMMITGHLDEGLDAIRRVLAEIGTSLPTSRARTLGSLLVHRGWLRVRGLGFRSRDESEVAVKELRRQEVFQAVSHGLSFIDPVLAQYFQARGLGLAFRLGEPIRVGRALAFEAMYLACSSQEARARTTLAQCVQISAAHKDEYLKALAAGAGGVIDYFCGDLPRAVERIADAEHRYLHQPAEAALEASTTRIFRLLALRLMGSFVEMRALLPQSMDDARRCGDRFKETTLKRGLNILWLLDDDVTAARRMLDESPWALPTGSPHVQHWYEVRARLEIAMYTGAARATEAAAQASVHHTIGESLLMRVRPIRVESFWLTGRLALAQHDEGADDGLAGAHQAVRRLRREPLAHVQAWAELLAAGIAACVGDRARAAEHLREAIRAGEASHLVLCAQVARMRLAELGHAPDPRAPDPLAWMADQGVRNPARLAQTVAPGFARLIKQLA
jgi:hypothetical protein